MWGVLMTKRVCSVSIDIDTLACYAGIHGLAPTPTGPMPSDAPADAIYTHAMPRFLDMFAQYGIRATLFVIGRDIGQSKHADILKRAVDEGHELANHSYNHSYRLTQMSESGISLEVSQGAEAIESLLPQGEKVRGFRCPGYNTTPSVLKVLREQGYRYDSSVFPCPPYYLAKATIIGMLALRGRPSRSIVGSPQVLLSPNRPYIPGENPHREARGAKNHGHSEALWELPMSVLPGVRLPMIGTSILMYPRWSLGSFVRGMARAHSFLNLELHGIDIMDPRDPGAKPLLRHQPDLRVSLEEKFDRFHTTFALLARNHTFLPLVEAVDWIERQS